jgi:hypothetical protein
MACGDAQRILAKIWAAIELLHTGQKRKMI